MSVVPGDLTVDKQPPMAVPLRHFVIGLIFLVVGVVLGITSAAGITPGTGGLAHVHLLLAGWVCLTIMGAMVQFVPVWAGVTLYSRRLAVTQLWLVAGGVGSFAAALLVGRVDVLPTFAFVMLLGFWTFAYNLGRTLARVTDHDVTTTHFALALSFLVVATTLGFLLALDFTTPVLAAVGLSHSNAVTAHATLAVFGVVVTTVLGALYQLGTMFTQTTLHGIDHHVRRFETVAYPAGVVALAAGRLVGSLPIARLGATLVLAAMAGFGLVLARKLLESQVPRTPMLSRYAVVAVATVGWALLSIPSWWAGPTRRAALFGPPGVGHLLLIGVVGFVVVGTLYHVIPFIVWVHRYSDLLGFEPVPMIDDLYDSRVASVDFWMLVGGGLATVFASWLDNPTMFIVGGFLVLGGCLAFVANLLGVLIRHSPSPLSTILVGESRGDDDGDDRETESNEGYSRT